MSLPGGDDLGDSFLASLAIGTLTGLDAIGSSQGWLVAVPLESALTTRRGT